MPEQPGFRLIDPSEAEVLADWLAAEDWPFHPSPRVTREQVLASIEAGHYWSPSIQSVWILNADDQPIGFIRLFDLLELTALFDLRLSARTRGQGLGLQALNWLSRYIFEQFAGVHRISGVTRVDNTGMRRTFVKAGYVKESYHRKAWSAPGLKPHDYFDAVGYGLLRSDWLLALTTPVAWN